MSYLRELEQRQAEIVGLKTILLHMPDDPLAKPLHTSRLQGLETELAALEKHPPARPEAELLFAGRPAVGSVGLDAKFASKVLDSFQDMVANHSSRCVRPNRGSPTQNRKRKPFARQVSAVESYWNHGGSISILMGSRPFPAFSPTPSPMSRPRPCSVWSINRGRRISA